MWKEKDISFLIHSIWWQVIQVERPSWILQIRANSLMQKLKPGASSKKITLEAVRVQLLD